MEHEGGAFKVNRAARRFAVKEASQVRAFQADLMPVFALRCKTWGAVNLDNPPYLPIR